MSTSTTSSTLNCICYRSGLASSSTWSNPKSVPCHRFHTSTDFQSIQQNSPTSFPPKPSTLTACPTVPDSFDRLSGSDAVLRARGFKHRRRRMLATSTMPSVSAQSCRRLLVMTTVSGPLARAGRDSGIEPRLAGGTKCNSAGSAGITVRDGLLRPDITTKHALWESSLRLNVSSFLKRGQNTYGPCNLTPIY